MSAPEAVAPGAAPADVPLCRDCQHYRPSMFNAAECWRPLRHDIDLVKGPINVTLVKKAWRERISDRHWLTRRVKCGQAGRFFEPRPPLSPPPNRGSGDSTGIRGKRATFVIVDELADSERARWAAARAMSSVENMPRAHDDNIRKKEREYRAKLAIRLGLDAAAVRQVFDLDKTEYARLVAEVRG